MRSFTLGLLCALTLACRTEPDPGDGGADAADGGGDASADTGTDAGADTGTDTGTDAGADTGADADGGADVAPPPPPQNGAKLFEGDIDSLALSPDRTKVAIIAGGALKIRGTALDAAAAINVDTGVSASQALIWSDDGSYILYHKGTGTSRKAFIAGSDGSSPHEVLPGAPDTGVTTFSSWAPKGSSNVVFSIASTTVGLRHVFHGSPAGPWTKVAENVATPFVYSSNLGKILVSNNCTAGAAQGQFLCDLRVIDTNDGSTHDIITDNTVHRGGSHGIMLSASGDTAAYFTLLTNPDRESLIVVPSTGTADNSRVVVTGAAANPGAQPDPIPQELVGYVSRFGRADRFVWFQGPEWDDLYGVQIGETLAPVLLADYTSTFVWSDCRALGADNDQNETHLSFTTAADGEDYGEEWLLAWATPTTVRKPIALSALACSLTESDDRKWYAVVDGPSADGSLGALKAGRLADLADTTPTHTLGANVFESDFDFASDSAHIAFIGDTASPSFTGKLYTATLPATGAPVTSASLANGVYAFSWFDATSLLYLAEPDTAQPPFYKLYRGGVAPGTPHLLYEKTRTYWRADGSRVLILIEYGPDAGLWIVETE